MSLIAVNTPFCFLTATCRDIIPEAAVEIAVEKVSAIFISQ